MVSIEGKVHGPLSIEEIHELRRTGRLKDDALVAYHGESWDQAITLEESPILLSKLGVLEAQAKRHEEIHSRSPHEYQSMIVEEIRILRRLVVAALCILGFVAFLLLLIFLRLDRLPVPFRI